MYDFDNDGFITAEDVRIMTSYMPFNDELTDKNILPFIDEKRNNLFSPTRAREGLYEDEEGKCIDNEHRMNDQEEIKRYTDTLFRDLPNQWMDLSQYEQVIKTESSEMFYSLMAVLHKKLPCAKNYFRMRSMYKKMNQMKSSSFRCIASPRKRRSGFIPTEETTKA
jgi:hypothetical protein